MMNTKSNPTPAPKSFPLTGSQKRLVAELQINPVARCVQFADGKAFVQDLNTRQPAAGGRKYAERTVGSLIALGYLKDDNGNSEQNARAYWLTHRHWSF